MPYMERSEIAAHEIMGGLLDASSDYRLTGYTRV